MNYIDDWKKYILNNGNDSFGQYVFRSQYLDKGNYDGVKNMWNKFVEGVNPALSFVRFINVSCEDIISANKIVSHSLFIIFRSIQMESNKSFEKVFKQPKTYVDSINRKGMQTTNLYLYTYYSDKINQIFV